MLACRSLQPQSACFSFHAFFAALLTLFLMGCEKGSGPDDQSQGSHEDPNRAAILGKYSPTEILQQVRSQQGPLIQAEQQFSFEVFGKMLLADSTFIAGANAHISPFSIQTALALLWHGSRGETRERFTEAMGWANLPEDSLLVHYARLLHAVQNVDPKVTFDVANALWHEKAFQPLETFVQTNRSYFEAQVTALDFSQTAEALATINAWASEKTRGKIPTILTEINPDEVMFLMNALYFKGDWSEEFDIKSTREETFTTSEGAEVKAMFLRDKRKIAFFENDSVVMGSLPYGDSLFTITFLQPKKSYTHTAFLADLSADSWAAWKASMHPMREVDLSIPRFKVEQKYETSFEQALVDMGFGGLFGNPDLSGIHSTLRLAVSSVIHKTFIQLDEKGTEAAAITSIGVRATSAPASVPELLLNSPFFFAIEERTTGLILFMGMIQNPAD